MKQLIKQMKKSKNMAGVIIDLPMTVKNNAIYLDLVRIDKVPEIANAHPSDLELYAMGRHLPVMFFKSPALENGFKASFTTELTNKEFLSFIVGMKYNKFEISADGGYTRILVNSDFNSSINEIADSLQNANSKHDQEVRKLLIDEITNQVIEEYNEHGSVDEVEYTQDDKILCKIDDDHATKTSFRHQAIVPPTNPILGGQPVDVSLVKFYYTYYGQIFELETEFVSQKENTFEWDVKGLEPGKVYPGLSFSYGPSPIIPSDSLYGTTLNEKGKVPNIDEAELGKPIEGEKGHPMWDREIVLQFVEKHIIKKTCEIIIKKHHEDENEEDYLAISQIERFFDKYEWIPFNLEDLK